ncbi:MAG TPA: hypothetical protein VI461_17725, partial [Chitinophagaceae bacterium]|nr:hypothetical protein [Chitinophagaceae bacterium]
SSLLQKYKEGKAAVNGYKAGYDEYRDKLTTSLKYLDQKKDSLDKNVIQPLNQAKDKVAQLNNQLDNTEAVQQFIKERKRHLIQQTFQYIGQNRYLKKINKDSYYLAETLKNYKKIFSEPGKSEEAALTLLMKIPAFNEFFQKNSALAGLFRLPSDPNDPSAQANLAGLQTRAQVNNLIQQQISGAGPNAMDQFRQNLSEAQNQLNQLKSKVNQFGGSSSDDIMPEGFSKNDQRTKSFWQKWEFSTGAQSVKANSFFPATTDLSLMAGFRPHNGLIVGVGFGSLIGWGRDIRHIAISYQGLSGKSFAEIKIRGSFHFAAGFELNYRNEIRNFDQLRDYSAFQKSGLIGLSKLVAMKSKFFKKTKLQLLWDYLSFSQKPRTQSLLFRIGYTF